MGQRSESQDLEVAYDNLGGFLESADAAAGTEYAAALKLMLRNVRREAFGAGFQQAAQVEQRAAREALARYALEVLGKDAGDGAIDLGALGTHQAS